MKSFFAFVLVLVVLIPMTVTLAEEVEVNGVLSDVDDARNLDIVLSYEDQSPKTKQFYVVATITAGIDSDRVVIEWDLDRGLNFVGRLSVYDNTSVRKGETSIVRRLVEPNFAGSKDIKAVVTAVKADVNYISSDTLDLELNQSREISPQTEEYKESKMMYQAWQAFQIVSVVLGAGLVGALFVRWLRKIRS